MEASFVTNPPADSVHQDIMIHGVEEFQQISAYRHAVSFADKITHIVHRPVGRLSRTESKTGLRKERGKDRQQYPGNGLLDQPVQDGWNTKRGSSPGLFPWRK
jgi:hypothetical protein